MPATQESLADGVAVSDAYDVEGRPVQMHRVATDHDPIAAWPAVLSSFRLNGHDTA